MNNYKGVIIEKSLVKKDVLRKVKTLSTKVVKVSKKHQTPWLSQWTLHTVEIPENKAQVIAKEISQSLDPSHKNSWYVDYKNENYHYIIFYDKIFFINRKDKEKYNQVKSYGISIGIPEHQLDFDL